VGKIEPDSKPDTLERGLPTFTFVPLFQGLDHALQ
jgi:hypothetical protein